jgi:hypothetical protein
MRAYCGGAGLEDGREKVEWFQASLVQKKKSETAVSQKQSVLNSSPIIPAARRWAEVGKHNVLSEI